MARDPTWLPWLLRVVKNVPSARDIRTAPLGRAAVHVPNIDHVLLVEQS